MVNLPNIPRQYIVTLAAESPRVFRVGKCRALQMKSFSTCFLIYKMLVIGTWSDIVW